MKKLFTENFGLKATALALALLLEAYFYSPDNSVTVILPVPVQVLNLSPSMIVVEPAEELDALYARVRLSGPSQLIEQVKTAPLRFSVKLPIGVQSSFPAKLDSENLRLPSGVDVQNIEPKVINFRLERVVKKELPIESEVVGTPGLGFRYLGTTLTPSTVLARGPRSLLEAITVLKTQQIDLEGLTSSRKMDILIQDPPRLVSLSVNVVTADVEIEPVMEEHVISNVPVKLKGLQGFAASVRPGGVEIMLNGPKIQIDKIREKNSLELVVDCQGLSEGKHSLVPVLDADLGVKIIKMEPEKVTVVLVKEAK